MKSLKSILEGVLGDISAAIDKEFPAEISDIIALWKKVKLVKSDDPDQLQATPDNRAFDAFYDSYDLLEKCDCERVSLTEIMPRIRQHEDAVVIKVKDRDHRYGMYIYYAKTEECLKIYESSVVDDRRGGFGINSTVFVQKSSRANMLYISSKPRDPKPYLVLPAACWEPLKKALQP